MAGNGFHAALPSVLGCRDHICRAVSFNFHTPYPGTEYLKLSREEKQDCCGRMESLIDAGYPVLNLRSVFPYLMNNTFKAPCRQCVIMENGRQWVCGRCIDIKGLCQECGFFFAAGGTRGQVPCPTFG